MTISYTVLSIATSQAPTALVANQKMVHEMEKAKMKIEFQQDKINELTKERDYLKEQLASGKYIYIYIYIYKQ